MNSMARRMFQLVEPIGVIPYSAHEPNELDVRPGVHRLLGHLLGPKGGALRYWVRRRWWTRCSTTSLPVR